MLCYTITSLWRPSEDATVGQDRNCRPPGVAHPSGAERPRAPGLDPLRHAAAMGGRRLGPGLVVMSAAAIRLDDLTLGYDRHPAVHHLCGSFAPGSLTAVV